MFSRQAPRTLLLASRSLRQQGPVASTSVAHLHTTSRQLNQKSGQHTTDSYSKDVDSTPPDDSKIHRVDPGSENVQKPHEPPSGKWSKTGAETAYQHVSKSEPYKAPGEDSRYGGKEEYDKDKGPETSGTGSGPTGKAKGGMKP
ncbi:hypothetical protein PM082_004906 [Marasmius tenuissimus]|nr:hypothetical protein PM082_004906 [Marasmius tenuissimus]